MIKALIFDLDGVIVDTTGYHYLAWKKLADELGLRFNNYDNELLKGVSRIRSFEIILSLNGLEMPEADKNKYCMKKNGYYVEYLRHLSPNDILPGAAEFIARAREDGYRVALGSASKNARSIIDRLDLGDMFDAVIDGTMVTHAKPDPEVFLVCAHALGLHPEECLVFEDAVAGIVAAHNGGMKAIGVGNSEVVNCCDCFISSFNDTSPSVLVKKTGA